MRGIVRREVIVMMLGLGLTPATLAAHADERDADAHSQVHEGQGGGGARGGLQRVWTLFSAAQPLQADGAPSNVSGEGEHQQAEEGIVHAQAIHPGHGTCILRFHCVRLAELLIEMHSECQPENPECTLE
eukprot:CAMPEP_0114234582 /NCGR_PEP_ID=MMETSP0058-20121206/5784_1 /TAXON_ID=36894 /ORGANISM="Pyramimonas parkeae, CCMP726" /LENGTH=129 /DNA_ID=CAMNT_0001346267 /DNA_START=622 /DNA_END=1011 /DNA_ORIENTATION=+